MMLGNDVDNEGAKPLVPPGARKSVATDKVGAPTSPRRAIKAGVAIGGIRLSYFRRKDEDLRRIILKARGINIRRVISRGR
jgi:hypothetical protein